MHHKNLRKLQTASNNMSKEQKASHLNYLNSTMGIQSNYINSIKEHREIYSYCWTHHLNLTSLHLPLAELAEAARD